MIIWTLQPKSWWDILNSQGFINLDRDKFLTESTEEAEFIREYYLKSYDWMVEQMKLRISGYSSSQSLLPLWGWYQWDSSKKKTPDLRHYRNLKNHVRIEFEIDESLVLLSDFETWHFVLNNWMLRNDELDREEPKFSDEEKIKSWDQIFDLEFFGPRDTRCIQATFWELRIDQVRKVKEFGRTFSVK